MPLEQEKHLQQENVFYDFLYYLKRVNLDPGTEETFACWLALYRTEEASVEGCDGASFQEQGWC